MSTLAWVAVIVGGYGVAITLLYVIAAIGYGDLVTRYKRLKHDHRMLQATSAAQRDMLFDADRALASLSHGALRVIDCTDVPAGTLTVADVLGEEER